MPIPIPGSRVVSRVIDGQALLLDAGQDTLERLNEVGSFIWGLLREKRHDVEALATAVAAEFDVEPAVARADLLAFLGELEARGLVRYAPA